MVWGPNGELRAARAIWYEKCAHTNNVVEAFAMLEALYWLEDWGFERSARILVLGDSQLVLDFVARRSKPKV